MEGEALTSRGPGSILYRLQSRNGPAAGTRLGKGTEGRRPETVVFCAGGSFSTGSLLKGLRGRACASAQRRFSQVNFLKHPGLREGGCRVLGELIP